MAKVYSNGQRDVQMGCKRLISLGNSGYVTYSPSDIRLLRPLIWKY
jgi:hypothetical protein